MIGGVIGENLSAPMAREEDAHVGEALSRKKSDPYFGAIPKGGVGVIASHPTVVHRDGRLSAKNIDPMHLRNFALYFDRIVLPTNPAFHFSVADEAFLSDAELLTRPKPPLLGREFAKPALHMERALLRLFHDLDGKEKGAWAIAGGEAGITMEGKEFTAGQGALVQLYRAIPVPDRAIALEDVINFKEKRRDEIVRLNIAIRGIYKEVAASGDMEATLKWKCAEIDSLCSDLIKVSKESPLTFRLSDLQVQFSLPTWIAASAALLEATPLNAVEAIIGGAAISFSVGFGMKDRKTLDPFSYVTKVHSELF